MKKIWKKSIHKIVSCVLTLAVVGSLLPMSVLAAGASVTIDPAKLFIMSGTKITGFNVDYVTSDLGLTPNTNGDYELGNVEIPANVTQIGTGSGYSKNASLMSIDTLSFEAGSVLTNVAKYGLQGCLIDSIDFSNAEGLSSIDVQGFYQCDVSNITWCESGNLTTLAAKAFGDNKITGELFEIPDTVTNITGAAFYGIDVDVLVFPSSIQEMTKYALQGVTTDWCILNFDANSDTLKEGTTNSNIYITNTVTKDKASYDYVMVMTNGSRYLNPTYVTTLTFDGTDDGAGNAITKPVLYNREINWAPVVGGHGEWAVDDTYTFPAFTGDNNRWVISNENNDEIVVTDKVTFDTLYQYKYNYTHYEYLWFGEYQQNQIASAISPDGVPDAPKAVLDAQAAGTEVVFRDMGNKSDYRWYSVDPILWRIFNTVDNGDGTTTYTAVSEYVLAMNPMDADADATTFEESDLWNIWFEGEFNAEAFDKAAFDEQAFIDAGFTEDEWDWFDVSTGLLSKEDVTTNGYFPNAQDKETSNTQYCVSPISFGAPTGTYTDRQWLSTFGASSRFGNKNYIIDDEGDVFYLDQYYTMGVRPTITLTVDSKYNELVNAGTKADPYMIAPVTNTVSFVCDSTTTFAPQNVITGEKATEPTAPVKTGYTLDGWYKENTYTTKWDFATGTVAEDMTLYSKWVSTEYTITFKDGATVVDTATYTVNDTNVTNPTLPTKDGYTGTWPSYTISTTNPTDFDVQVDWTVNTYTLSFDLAGGAGTANDVTVTYDAAIGALPSVTKTGYTQDGWKIGADVITATTPWTYTEGKQATAQWDANEYTVTFDGNGATSGTMTVQDFEYDVAETLTPNDFEKTGFVFIGWDTDVIADAVVYTDAQSVPNLTAEKDGTVTLYAVWEAGDATAYKVVHETENLTGGGYTEVAAQNLAGTTGSPVTPPVNTYPGFTAPVTQTANILPDGSLVITYRYTRDSYTVTFDADGGVPAPADQSVKYQGTIAKPTEEMTKSGYTFSFWSADGTTEYDFTTTIAAGVTLKAVWTQNSSGGGTSYYTSILAPATNGSAELSSTRNRLNATVTVTTNPDDGYVVDSVVVTYGNGRTVSVTDSGRGTYTYKQPGATATVTVTFVTEEETDTDASLNRDDHMAYMKGYTDGTFGPNRNITRAEATVMFSRLLTNEIPTYLTATVFDDMTGDEWYADAVTVMTHYGIITGYTDGTFGGDKPITRAEFAAISSRFDDLAETDVNIFSDVPDDYWAMSYINSAVAKGWINGYTDGTFKPERNISRAEAVTLVNRVLDRSGDLDFIRDNLEDMLIFADVNDSYWAYEAILEAANSHDYYKANGKEIWTSLD